MKKKISYIGYFTDLKTRPELLGKVDTIANYIKNSKETQYNQIKITVHTEENFFNKESIYYNKSLFKLGTFKEKIVQDDPYHAGEKIVSFSFNEPDAYVSVATSASVYLYTLKDNTEGGKKSRRRTTRRKKTSHKKKTNCRRSKNRF